MPDRCAFFNNTTYLRQKLKQIELLPFMALYLPWVAALFSIFVAASSASGAPEFDVQHHSARLASRNRVLETGVRPGDGVTWTGWRPYHWAAHTNDLQLLAQNTATHTGWVSLSVFSLPMVRYAFNMAYTLRTYGGGIKLLAAALDAATLDACLKAGLACYNATAWAAPPNPDPTAAQTTTPTTAPHDAEGTRAYTNSLNNSSNASSVSGVTPMRIATQGSPQYAALVWACVGLSLQLLKLGFHVHHSDADVVYLRHVHASYGAVLSRFKADAVFMHEQEERVPATLMNGGVYAVRSNPRTIAMFEAWWDGGRRLKLPRNQPYLNSLRGTAYGLCYDATSCAALTRHKQPGKHGKAAVVLHPTQFSDYDKCPWRRPLFDEHGRSLCEPRFLFLHLICLAGAEKEGFMRSYGLWLVDERGLPLTGAGAGVYNAPGARSGLLAGAGAGLGHLGLPCGSRMAWSNRELWAHHLHVVWSEEFAANMNRSRVA